MSRKVIYREEKEKSIVFIYTDGSDVDVFSNYITINCKVLEGPYLNLPKRVPQELQAEISGIRSWRDTRSNSLETFCKECIKEASKLDKWFEVFV